MTTAETPGPFRIAYQGTAAHGHLMFDTPLGVRQRRANKKDREWRLRRDGYWKPVPAEEALLLEAAYCHLMKGNP